MKGKEFRELRVRAGVERAEVARIAGIPAPAARRWEEGAPLPRRERRALDHALWTLERDAALATMELPRCRIDDEDAIVRDGDLEALRAYARHVSQCTVCQARDTHVRERVRPEPVGGGVLASLGAFLERVFPAAPERPGPARWGDVRHNIGWGVFGGVMMALGLSAMAALPVLFMLVLMALTYVSQRSGVATGFFVAETIPMGWAILLVFPLYLAAGVAGGAVVGLMRPLARWRMGATLLGMIAGTIAYWSMGPAVAAFTGMRVLSLEHLAISLFLGSVVGGAVAFDLWERS